MRTFSSALSLGRRATVFNAAAAAALACSATLISAYGADVSLYSIEKGIDYDQTTTGAPVPPTKNAYIFTATLDESATNTVSAVSVLPPTGAAQSLPLSGAEFQFKKKDNKLSTINTSFPDGTYLLSVAANNDGAKSLLLTLVGAGYPNAPHINSFNPTATFDPGAYLLVSWDPLQSGNASDFIQLRLEDDLGNKLFETPDFGKVGALDGTATLALIPRSSFAPGQTNKMTLRFERFSDKDYTSYPGARGLAGYYTRTSLLLAASATPTVPDAKTYSLLKIQDFQQSGSGQPAPATNAYSVQAVINPLGTNGVVSATFNPPSGASAALLPMNGNFEFDAVAANQAAIDQTYGTGVYQFQLQTVAHGVKQASLALPADAFPAAPHFVNYAAAQAIRAEQTFTFQWDAFSGSSASDFIELRIEDSSGKKVYETSTFAKSDGLQNSAVALTLPANALGSGNSYKAILSFQRNSVIDTTSYPGALGYAGFVTRTTIPIQTTSPDVKYYGVSKGQLFIQSGTALPSPLPGNSYELNAFLTPQTSNSVVSARFWPPAGTNQARSLVNPNPAAGKDLAYTQTFAAQPDLDSQFPNTTYSMQIVTAHDGSPVLPLPLPPGNFPTAPQVQNLDALSAVDPNAAFTLSWAPVLAPKTTDYIIVSIADSTGAEIFATKGPGRPTALNGTVTSLIIPPQTLAADANYTATLTYFATTGYDNTNYPGAVGLTGRFATTQFYIGAKGSGNPPQIVSFGFQPGGAFQLQGLGLPGSVYYIQYSSDLPAWLTASTNTAVNGLITYTDATAPSAAIRFYRLVKAP